MNNVESVDISGIKFSSTTFPTPEDRALWESLTPAQRLAIVERDEDAGFQRGVAPNGSMREVLVLSACLSLTPCPPSLPARF